MAEQGSYKAKVPGSNPGAPTVFYLAGGWRSWLARVVDIDEVIRSNRIPPTTKGKRHPRFSWVSFD